MKIKVSISIEESLYEKVKKKVEDSIFRNKSHLIEHAVKTFLKGGQKNGF